MHETNVAHVADPLGGSHFVEELTEEIERRAEAIFSELDEMGRGSMLDGVIDGIEENWFQGRIADSAFELERAFNAGERIVVGVNAFTEGNDDDDLDILRITHDDEQRQRRRLEVVRAERDGDAVAAALAELRSVAADPDANVMPALIDASRASATLGEQMRALGDVFGRHVEVPTI